MYLSGVSRRSRGGWTRPSAVDASVALMTVDLIACLLAPDAGQPWSGGGDGSSLIRVTAVGGVTYHVKLPCGPERSAEPWWGPANELIADRLMAQVGIARPRHALVRFPGAALDGLSRLAPPAHPDRHPTDVLGFGREILRAKEAWVPWDRINPGQHAWLVAQDAVLRWLGAGADHTRRDKGFLACPSGPIAIDLGGTDLGAAWERAGETTRRVGCDYGGLRAGFASIERRLIGDALARIVSLEPSFLRTVVGAVPDEWASAEARGWVLDELLERRRWLLASYGRGRAAA